MKSYFSGLLSRFRSLRLWVIFLLLPFAVLPTIAVASAVDWHWQNTVVSFDKFRIYIKDTHSKDSNPSPVLCSRFDSTGMSYVVDIPSTHKLSEHNGKTCVISDKGKIDRLTVHYLYASNPSDCSFTITGSPKGIGHSRKLHKLTSGVRIDSGGRIPIRKNGKQCQVALSPSYEHYLEGYFHRKNFKSSTVEVPLILKPNGRKGAEAVLDLSAYPQRCRKPDTVIIHRK